jgi:hypothetical protein
MLQKPRVMLAACLIAAAFAARAQPESTQEQAPDRQRDAGSPDPGDERAPPKPATTFTPSEEIGADSAVSFPVDI